jgi:MoaA/NifB/PqqE/SkfB family radical SAM enzyme
MLPPDRLAAFHASRAPGVDRSVLCHAPFASLNFDQSGAVTACCYNRRFRLGTYPQQTLREIWTGASARALREAFLAGAEAPGCEGCFDQLRAGNYAGALLRNFDSFGIGEHGRAREERALPLLLEFEIANTCALECVMCGGHWSSAIRSRREHLPPLANPYDESFLEQVEELLPTVVGTRFLGGEPFLIPAYLRIWDGLRRLNPRAAISITTSGAMLPDPQRQMLEELRADIVVSLDGVTAATYESIRRNADFEQVMANVLYFRDYTRRRGTTLTLAVCPMTHNWRELPAIVDFCEAEEMTLFFNTVTHPPESALGRLEPGALTEVVAGLEADARSHRDRWSASRRSQWDGLLHQLRAWLRERQTAAAAAEEKANETRLQAEREAAGHDRRRQEALERLAALQLPDSRRAATAPHLEALVAARFLPTARALEGLRWPEVASLTELFDALTAVRIFGDLFESGARVDLLRRRLERVEALLRATPPAHLSEALRGADAVAIGDFLNTATEADFERALGSFGA